ncbi:MAG: glycosyltransferase family 2 protein [Bacteroidaceae bacterium]|nr:glycosyltransferase family 2 protein [Bacteroidaceae bacterium]
MISVVIPLYNKERSIRMTLDSVLKQTYRDFEVVVVDDGSTDKGASVVKEYTRNDSRIRLVGKANGGVSSARNEGIRQAKNELIAFLDADDVWDPHYLETLYGLFLDFPDAGIWGLAWGWMKNGVKSFPEFQNMKMNFRGMVESVWDKGQLYWTSSSSSRKSLLMEMGMFDERISHGEDTDMWIRLLLQRGGAFYNIPMAFYQLDAENRAMNRAIPLEKLYIYYFEKYEKWRKENASFRHYIDKECMWWLFPYLLKNPHNQDAQRILAQIDLNEYKFSFRFRFAFPRLYSFLKNKTFK